LRLAYKGRRIRGFERRLRLREEPGLDLLGDFDFLRSAAFGIQPLGKSAALASTAWVTSSKLTSEKELPSDP